MARIITSDINEDDEDEGDSQDPIKVAQANDLFVKLNNTMAKATNEEMTNTMVALTAISMFAATFITQACRKGHEEGALESFILALRSDVKQIMEEGEEE